MRATAPLRVRTRPHLRGAVRRWVGTFSIFEKVILANSVIIVLDTAAGWWLTQHHAETYHYLIDTGFIVLAVLAGLAINFALLRAAFAPLYGVLATIRAIERGDLGARAVEPEQDADTLALARAFNAMLDDLARLRDESAGRVLRGQEEERQRLALELHDQTGQSLTALTLHAQAIAQRLEGVPGDAAAQARQSAQKLVRLTEATLAEVQALARQLRPPLLDDAGLAPALRWLASAAGDQFGLDVRVRVRGGAGGEASGEEATRLPGDVETALFRIAQEGLTNAVRHGHARRVRLALRLARDRATFVVADDGRGFALPRGGERRGRAAGDAGARAGAGHGGGLGLEGMGERARLLGGTCAIRSAPGRGCAVRVVVPLPPALSVPSTAATAAGTSREERAS